MDIKLGPPIKQDNIVLIAWEKKIEYRVWTSNWIKAVGGLELRTETEGINLEVDIIKISV
jgi:hypothetical protein